MPSSLPPPGSAMRLACSVTMLNGELMPLFSCRGGQNARDTDVSKARDPVAFGVFPVLRIQHPYPVSKPGGRFSSRLGFASTPSCLRGRRQSGKAGRPRVLATGRTRTPELASKPLKDDGAGRRGLRARGWGALMKWGPRMELVSTVVPSPAPLPPRPPCEDAGRRCHQNSAPGPVGKPRVLRCPLRAWQPVWTAAANASVSLGRAFICLCPERPFGAIACPFKFKLIKL